MIGKDKFGNFRLRLSSVCGERNCSLMALVLFVKKIAKSSAVRVDEREEKVLNSVRESGQLLNLLW